MKKEEKQSFLTDIANLKKELLMMRIKASSGESVIAKDYKSKKKEIARLFTKINSNIKAAKA
jgi:ribosomal protein L29